MSAPVNSDYIPLYRSRKLGEKINDAVDFMKQNRTVLTRLSLYILLPVSIVQSIVVYGISNIVDVSFSRFWRSVLTYSAVAMLSGLFVITIAVTLIAAYREHGAEWLREAGLAALWKSLWRNFRRTLLALLVDLLFIFPMMLVMMLVMIIPLAGFAFPVLMALLIGILLLLPVVYTLDNDTSLRLGDAISKTWRLSWAQWGKLMGLMIVIAVIMTIIQGVVDLPFYALLAGKEILYGDHESAGGLGSSIVYNIVFFLVTVVKTLYSAVAEVLAMFILIYHYGSVADVEEDASLSSDISNFENL